jgi:capsular exopolysaccharide synthesis family protein
LIAFRTANKIDNLVSSRDTVQQGLSKITADILNFENQESQLVEWEKILVAVQKEPETFGALSAGIPRAEDITREYNAFQDADGKYHKLTVAFTDNHPDVIAEKKNLEISKQRFLDAVARARQAGSSTLAVVRSQLAKLRAKSSDLSKELESLGQRIGIAETRLKNLQDSLDLQTNQLKSLKLNESEARFQAEQNSEMVRLGRRANPSDNPVLPNPLFIFGAGIVVSVGLGFVFVLVLDNLEDTVVNLSDIEVRLALKVLAVLPHVRKKKRAEVAKTLISDAYSQFAESVAGLRNLLDSPRYEALSKCMLFISTQPGEGKTITSTSMAIAYAKAGKKVLHVDFDMRRPRIAKIWGIELSKEKSFSHVLAANSGGTIDFSKLATSISEVENLDIICSLSPDGISPANILGSSVIVEFFNWARVVYDKIIVDSPPFGVVGDVVSLGVAVDSVLIMCCPDRTHFRPIQYCSRSLTEAGANILGVIVNDVELSNSAAFSLSTGGRGYAYSKYGYSKYGYGYGAQKPKKKQKEQPPGEDSEEVAPPVALDGDDDSDFGSSHSEFIDEE